MPPEAADARTAFRQGMREGVRATVPFIIALATWGLVTGVAMVKSGLTESLALTMTFVVYAGSAQLTSLPLIAAGAPVWLIFAAGLVVNLRFVIFAAALHPYMRHLSWRRRLVLGYFTSDMAFVAFMARYGNRTGPATPGQLGFFMGCIAPTWLTWQVASVVGIYLGTLVPSAWSPEFAAILALLAITVPLVKTRPAALAAVAAGAVAWVGQPLPLRLGLVAAVVTGVVVGMWAERATRTVPPPVTRSEPGNT